MIINKKDNTLRIDAVWELSYPGLYETVARVGTFTAVADQPHITQPALSKSMAQLEVDLTLFYAI